MNDDIEKEAGRTLLTGQCDEWNREGAGVTKLRGHSVNDGIEKELASLSYVGTV